MLITEPYRALNRQLHDTDPAYGISGARYADIVRQVSDRIGSREILDYGCGKRTLERDLRFPIHNYDPAVSGCEAAPSPADTTVCTDVLEHVEPDRLHEVLAHLVRLTKREIIVSVGLGPAVKHLADGRNAHLIQQTPEWWSEKLSARFRLQREFGFEGRFLFIGQSLSDQNETLDFSDIGPPPTVKTITTKSSYTDEQRMRNIRSSMLRGLGTVRPLPAHDKTMVLVCPGPSLADTMDELLAEDGDIWTVSGAHGFLIDRGIVPLAHVESDPKPVVSTRLGTPHPGVCYFLASSCDRSLFDILHDREVWLFHVTSFPSESELIKKLDPTTFTLDCGTSVGTSAISLGTALGYRRFSIYGMDCSFRADEAISRHARWQPGDVQPLYRVWIKDRPFLTSPQMCQAAQDFIVMRGWPGIVLNLHGDGYLPNLVRYAKDLKDEQRAAQDLRRVRLPPASVDDRPDALDYQARFKAGLRRPAGAGHAAHQA